MRRIALVPSFAAALLAGAVPAAAQIPERFENLKVLPRDIPRDSLLQVMRGFAMSLGVRCQYCHVQRQGADGRETFDFKADDKAPKDKARFMMRMVRDLNTQVLPQVPHRHDPPVGVGCVTCHRGLPIPTTLDRVLTTALDSGGAPAAIARYRQLRQESMASGRYDFSEGSINELARRLASQGKTAEAAALLEMNGEFYPASGQVDFQLGEVYRMRGERDKALVRYRMAQQKDPNNPQIRRRIDELSGAAAPVSP
ncbi:MAG TPA: c-type cytochrome [Longimicrobium sp.]|jgi:tetratricopeptide (TPR) repeat protein|nr:c-type cytochrome [Longimicrobium sp.]